MASGRDGLCLAPVPSAFPQGSWPRLFRPLCTVLRGWRFVKIISWWKLEGCWPALHGGGGGLPTGHPRSSGGSREGVGGSASGAVVAPALCHRTFSAGTWAGAAAPHPLSPQDHWAPAAWGPGWWQCRKSHHSKRQHGPYPCGPGFESQVCWTRPRGSDDDSDTWWTLTGPSRTRSFVSRPGRGAPRPPPASSHCPPWQEENVVPTPPSGAGDVPARHLVHIRLPRNVSCLPFPPQSLLELAGSSPACRELPQQKGMYRPQQSLETPRARTVSWTRSTVQDPGPQAPGRSRFPGTASGTRGRGPSPLHSPLHP